jgi:hypothetical protein
VRDFRYRSDVGFERRCDICHDWWPVSLEFWNPKWLSRCRACALAWRREYQNEKYAEDPKFREVRKEAARLSAWKQRVNEPAYLKKRRAKSDAEYAERRRELQRLAYWARRDEILAKRRARKAA